jgi:hypothetical protein
MKIIEKAYRVWVYSMLHEYENFYVENLDITYASKASEAKHKANIDWYYAKNEDGDKITWIDIKCRRVPALDKIEIDGRVITRIQHKMENETNARIAKLQTLDENKMYYMQDARNYVGNAVVWWRKDGGGYGCDIREAHKYTKEELVAKFTSIRDTDIVWEADHIETIIKPIIDAQGLKYEFSV